MEDDIYEGMHIPKGSIIFGNIWCVFKVPIRWLIIYNSADLHRRAMLRNEKVYPDPHVFRPERFLEPVTPEMERKRNPMNYVFGFGRRSVYSLFLFGKRQVMLTLHNRRCPGMNLVDSSVWLLVASLLATIDISKAVDEHGKIVEPVVQFENPIFRQVVGFFTFFWVVP